MKESRFYQNEYYSSSFSVNEGFSFVETDSSSILNHGIDFLEFEEELGDLCVEELKYEEVDLSYQEDLDFFIASLFHIDYNYYRKIDNCVGMISSMNLAYEIENCNLDVA